MSGRRKTTRVGSKAEVPIITINPKRKRQLVSTACLCCQTKHRACGIERPCFQCVRFGVECIEGEERKKIRKKRTSKKAKAEKEDVEEEEEEPPSPSSPSPPASPEDPLSCQASDSTSAPSSPPNSPHTPAGYHHHLHSHHHHLHSHNPNTTNFHEFAASPSPSASLPHQHQPQQHTVSLSYVEDILFNPNNNTPNFTTDLLSTFNHEPLPVADPPFYANIPPIPPISSTHPITTPISTPPFLQSNSSPLYYNLNNQYIPPSATQPNFLRSIHRPPNFHTPTSPSLYSQTPSHNFAPNTTHSSHSDEVRRLTEEVAMLKKQLDEKSGGDETITGLKHEVSLLKAQLSDKQPSDKPLLVSSIASGNWRLPDGPILDSSKSLYVKLKLPRSKLKNFDDHTAKEELADMNMLQRRLAHERAPTMNRIGYRTVQCGNGNMVTFMSCGLMLKFDDNGEFQSSDLWNSVE